MNCESFRNQLSKYLDERWVRHGTAIQFPPELEEHARECGKCATLLETARLLVVPEQAQLRAPDGLVDRVMEAVLLPEQKKETAFQRARVSRMLGGVAAAAVLVLASVFTTTWVLNRNDIPDAVVENAQQPIVVRLEFHSPAAESVAVVGDWNEWDPQRHRMVNQGDDGVWEIEIEVLPNREYRYQFLIDGEQWVPDPSAPITVSDGFGGSNSVLNI